MKRAHTQTRAARRQVRELPRGIFCRRLRELAGMDPDDRGERRPLEPGAIERAIARVAARDRRDRR